MSEISNLLEEKYVYQQEQVYMSNDHFDRLILQSLACAGLFVFF